MSTAQTQNELRSARRRALFSIFLNIFLAVSKGIAGVAANSTAMLGDAIHSATDVLASAAAYVGLWVAGRKHPSFPYGLYKAETIATLVTSLAVILAAYEIGRQAILGPERLPDVGIALPVALLSFVIALAFGLVQQRAGKKLNSPALMADARDYLADSLSTAVVLIGLIASWFGYAVDRWAAAIVSLFVFRSGGHLLLSAIKDLLDASIDRDTERAIIQMVEAHPRVTKVKRCLSRTAGGRFIVDMDVILRTPSHEVADQVSDRLEEEIPEKFPRVVMARIRPHFGRADVLRRLTPVDHPDGEGKIYPHLGKAPWFLLEKVEAESGRVLAREFLENPHCHVEKKKGLLVGSWLLLLKPDIVIVPEEAAAGTAMALLREAGVDIEAVGAA